MTGILIKLNDRPDIIFENGTFYGGLHCGECLSVFKENVGWVPVRLEFTDDWVLVDGGRAKILDVYKRQFPGCAGNHSVFPVPYSVRKTG